MEQQPATPYREKVYQYLIQEIANQHYQEGDMLNERSIARELEVSRTPVREAIQTLEAEGWVTVVPWKGIFVCGVSRAQMEEVFQIRSSLEVLAAELLAERVTPEQLAGLQELVEEQKRYAVRKHTREFIRLDRDFHNAIAAYGGNNLLQEYLEQLNNQLIRLGLTAVRNFSRFRRTINEHEKLLRAMEAGNRKDAARAMRDHIEKTRVALLEQLIDQKGEHHEAGADSDGG